MPRQVRLSQQARFLHNPNNTAEDDAAGLRRASEKGWLIDEGGIVRLTESGSKEL